jgi:hypothetical protein
MGVEKIRRPVLTPAIEAAQVNTDHVDLRTTFLDGVLEGRLQWNAEDGTLEYGLPGGNVVLQVGQEHVVKVVNKTGDDIPNGTPIYVIGAQGSRPKIAPAKADSIITTGVVGMTTEAIVKNASGYVTTVGLVRSVRTIDWIAGTLLYLSSTVAGGLTSTRPIAPDFTVFVGYVLFQSGDDGVIIVSPIIIPRLLSLSDVLEGNPDNGDTIRWSTANQRFELGP